MAAHDAHMAYDTLVNSLNGGTNFGSYAYEDSPGIFLQNALAAVPGETPMWGQHGDFLITVGDSAAYVKYEPTFSINCMQYHAVRQTPFVSATGYWAEMLSGEPAAAHSGKTVRETAIDLFERRMKTGRKPVYPERIFYDYAKLPFVIKELGEPVTKVPRGTHVLIKSTNQVGIIVGRQSRRSKLPAYTIATLTNSKTNPEITEDTYEYSDFVTQDAEQLSKLTHPGKYLTYETVLAMHMIRTVEQIS